MFTAGAAAAGSASSMANGCNALGNASHELIDQAGRQLDTHGDASRLVTIPQQQTTDGLVQAHMPLYASVSQVVLLLMTMMTFIP